MAWRPHRANSSPQAVVGGVDDHRIIRDAEAIQILKQSASKFVVPDHAVGFEAEPNLADRLRFEVSKDVHPGGVEVAEEKFASLRPSQRRSM